MPIRKINSRSISDGAIVVADVADGAVTDAKIASGVSASKLTGALPAIDGSSLTGVDPVDGSITTAKLADSAVTAGKLNSTLDLSSKTITGIPVTNEFAQYVRNFGAAVDGDSASSGWNNVGLNTEVSDTIGATFSAPAITLPAGTYFVIGYCQIYECNRAGARLVNTAGTSTLMTGGCGYSSATYNGGNLAYVSGQMSDASPIDLYFQVYAGNAGTLGLRPNSGQSWQQSCLNIWKIA